MFEVSSLYLSGIYNININKKHTGQINIFRNNICHNIFDMATHVFLDIIYSIYIVYNLQIEITEMNKC